MYVAKKRLERYECDEISFVSYVLTTYRVSSWKKMKLQLNDKEQIRYGEKLSVCTGTCVIALTHDGALGKYHLL